MEAEVINKMAVGEMGTGRDNSCFCGTFRKGKLFFENTGNFNHIITTLPVFSTLKNHKHLLISLIRINY